jgi:hypothetical protein
VYDANGEDVALCDRRATVRAASALLGRDHEMQGSRRLHISELLATELVSVRKDRNEGKKALFATRYDRIFTNGICLQCLNP